MEPLGAVLVVEEMAGTVVPVVGILLVADRSGVTGRTMAGMQQLVAGTRPAGVGMQQVAAGTRRVVAGKRQVVGKLVEVTPPPVVGKLHHRQGQPAGEQVCESVGPFQPVVEICTWRTLPG